MSQGEDPEEATSVVRKETCTNCKGNRYIAIKAPTGRPGHIKCPHCGGAGYKVRIVH